MEITIFENAEFGSIRTAGTAEEPLFCLADVCRVLELRTDAVKSRLKDAPIRIGVTDSLGRKQQALFVNEQNLYKVIMRSDKPQAEPFQDWVCGEVLPSIRKKGGYIHTTEEDTPDVIMAKALILAQQTIEEKKKIIASQLRVLEENRPKVAFAEAVEASSECINVHTLAKIICQKGGDIGEKRLYAWLREIGLIMQKSTQPTQIAMNMKLFRIEYKLNTKDGQYYPVTMVTPKGQRYILGKYFEY